MKENEKKKPFLVRWFGPFVARIVLRDRIVDLENKSWEPTRKNKLIAWISNNHLTDVF